MNSIDSRIVINPGNGPLTPAETAVVAYQAYRDARPLPDGWGQSFLMVLDADMYFSCYLENPDYLAVFQIPPMPYPGWVGRLAMFRKDRSTPTALEAVAVAHRLFHPYLAPHPALCPRPIRLDSDILARPLDYGPGVSRRHTGLELELQPTAGCWTPPELQGEYPVPVAIARPLGKDPKATLAAIRLLLEYEVERHEVVRAWIEQQHAQILDSMREVTAR